MSSLPSPESFSSILRRIQDQDPSARKDARNELFHRTYTSLLKIAGWLLRKFPDAQRQHEGATSIANQVALKMLPSFESGTEIRTLEDFLRVYEWYLRNYLIEEAQKFRRRPRQQDLTPPNSTDARGSLEPPDSQPGPSGRVEIDEERLRMLLLLNDAMTHLSQEERQVVYLLFHMGKKQSEVAEEMNLHPRKVSRLWIAARVKLGGNLPSDLFGETDD